MPSLSREREGTFWMRFLAGPLVEQPTRRTVARSDVRSAVRHRHWSLLLKEDGRAGVSPNERPLPRRSTVAASSPAGARCSIRSGSVGSQSSAILRQSLHGLLHLAPYQTVLRSVDFPSRVVGTTRGVLPSGPAGASPGVARQILSHSTLSPTQICTRTARIKITGTPYYSSKRTRDESSSIPLPALSLSHTAQAR